jgi:hypothetical protein
MPELLAALDAFLQEHRRCGELDAALEAGRCGWRATVAAGLCIRSSPTELEGAREHDGL